MINVQLRLRGTSEWQRCVHGSTPCMFAEALENPFLKCPSRLRKCNDGVAAIFFSYVQSTIFVLCIYIYVCDVYSIRLLNCQHMIPSKICVCIRIYIYITHTFMCTCNYIHRLLKCQTWYFDRIFFLGLSGQARAYWAGEGDAPPSAQGLVRQASSWESVFSAACCCISLDRVGYYCWV